VAAEGTPARPALIFLNRPQARPVASSICSPHQKGVSKTNENPVIITEFNAVAHKKE
jgi:hypothetical protein